MASIMFNETCIQLLSYNPAVRISVFVDSVLFERWYSKQVLEEVMQERYLLCPLTLLSLRQDKIKFWRLNEMIPEGHSL